MANSGCDPLTPEDIAEVVVFVAGRPQNVVIADTLIFPSHQVSRVKLYSGVQIADFHQAGAGVLYRRPT
jgi:3-hydroxy acid dehydrogenase/malonic semialdehyde reductase